ncbi:uncharacterized protein [Triticum aestivum]|uniref:uncharacterized protein n=1 Tax=Triticum aestivum TaxID=4565 RepID=UPI001D008C28|nr:uncharacterized protein LOC123103241 [Triticum aestivum]
MAAAEPPEHLLLLPSPATASPGPRACRLAHKLLCFLTRHDKKQHHRGPCIIEHHQDQPRCHSGRPSTSCFSSSRLLPCASTLEPRLHDAATSSPSSVSSSPPRAKRLQPRPHLHPPPASRAAGPRRRAAVSGRPPPKSRCCLSVQHRRCSIFWRAEGCARCSASPMSRSREEQGRPVQPAR